MKLPADDQEELERRGRIMPPSLPGGGAAGRLAQDRRRRGLSLPDDPDPQSTEGPSPADEGATVEDSPAPES